MKFPWSHSTLVDVLMKDSSIHHKCDKVCHDLTDNKLSLAEFVEELGPGLTHEDNVIRMKTTLLLSNVLTKLPSNLLNENQMEFLTMFYCDRMKDHHSVIPAILEGLLAFAAMDNLPKGSSWKILNSLFQNIPCQSQPKDDRTKYFLIVKQLADKTPEELQSVGVDFVYGVIGAIDGERDPRNLIFLFDYMPTFLKRYSLFHMTEEMFEVFACYFPVDFHPNQDDPEAITRDSLSQKLENCLCACNSFAEHCIPLLVEKMESDLDVAKLDSLRLLIKCTQAFPLIELDHHLEDIWKVLKMELLPGHGNKEVYDLALEATRHLVLVAHTDLQNENRLLTCIFMSILGAVSDVSTKLFEYGVKIAMKCADASDEAALFTSNKLLPIAFSQMQESVLRESEKLSLIEMIHLSLVCCKRKCVLHLIADDLVKTSQKLFIQALVQEKDSMQLRKVVVRCVTSIPEIVTDDNRYVVYTTIVDTLLNSDDDSVFVEDCLYQFAQQYSTEVLSIVVEKLILRKYENTAIPTPRVFQALVRLLPLMIIRDVVANFFINIFFGDPLNEEVAVVALNCWQRLLEKPESKELSNELCKQYNLIERFTDFVHQSDHNFSNHFLYAVSVVLKIIMKQLSPEKQQTVVNKYLVSMDLTQAKDLYLTSGILGYLDETVTVENHFEHLVDDLTKLSMDSEDDNIKDISNHLLCSLFNKMPNDEHHRNVLVKILAKLRSEIKNNNKKAVAVLSWIGKGLLAKNHHVAGEIVEDLAELLDHPSLGTVAALAFEILSAAFPKLHLPLIKGLFKQKLFVLVMKKLEQKVEQYAETHLTALIHVYQIAPHIVLKTNMDKVGPVLLKCLLIKDENAVIKTIHLISRFIQEEDVFFRDHLQTLIPQLTHLSVSNTKLKIRLVALECLLNVTKYPPFLLLPYKQDVLLDLQKALDDHKRLVRTAAVAARLQWFLVGSGEHSKDADK
ncbi:MMS19 nucleotide excision repair protein [Uranotaenia lowii]|uniref:MMS19 nucleotide excision repair protein n=1 Tax=Uranotaenia lowii TaxID=190385 RepID=UPI00247AE38A|nr:MMS19 nucleotide excision repair protein [Uranotaenia lowii]